MNEIIGTRQGIYDVLYECDFTSKDGHKMYHVKCSKCGWETDMQKRHIKLAKQCIHLTKDKNYIHTNTNSKTNKRLRRTYNDMIDRCYDKKDKSYRFYGYKGITVCEDWKNNFSNFEKWALENGYTDNLTIDRIDSSKEYCPENCRWITSIENAKYKSTTKLLEVDGVAHTGRDWAIICNLGINTINKMLKKYNEEDVKKFIKLRLKNPYLKNKSHHSLLETYDII